MNIMDILADLHPKFKPTTVTNLLNLIGRLEQTFFAPLPKDYAEFLVADGRGVSLETNKIVVSGESNPGSFQLDFLYGLDDYQQNLFRENSTYLNRIPVGFLTIGTSAGDDQICLDISALRPGAVYYWDHEREVDERGRKQPDYSNMTLLARSFLELLERTKLVAEDSTPSRAVSANFKFKLPGRP